MEVIVLNNINDKSSRDFVANLPAGDGNNYTVIDWYGAHCKEIITCTCFKGSPYPGSTPSAFPELVFYDSDPPATQTINPFTAVLITHQETPAWVNIRAAQSVADITDRNKYGARTP